MDLQNLPPSTKDNNVVPEEDPNWQAKKTKVCERLSVLFNNDLMADIKFLVGTDDHIQTVPAHKLILATGSPVFYAMFYGGLAENKSEIRLPDVELSAFLTLLKYLYCDEIHLEVDNFLATLYVSKKYMVPHLTAACVNFLETSLTAENVCFLLSQSRLFEEPDLSQRCLEFIDVQTDLVIQSEGFLNIDLTILESILCRDSLKCNEIDLFEATVKWADAACKKMDIQSTSQNRRDVLGKALTMIRFPIMTLNEFANRVAHLEILTPEESTDIFRTITADKKPNIFNFPTKQRTEHKKMICNRVNFDIRPCNESRESSYKLFNFSVQLVVNKKISIIGFGIDELFMDFILKDYNVKIELKREAHVLAVNNTTFLKDPASKTLQFLFKDPVQIDPKICYTAYISLVMNQNMAYVTEEVKHEMYIKDAIFTFQNPTPTSIFSYGSYGYSERRMPNLIQKIIYKQ